ncbi:MAG: O-antigen ligase family protein, partial [Candidatus Dormibacteraceae bacterium]
SGERERPERLGEPFFRASKCLILAVLFLSPLAFGAVEPWAWGIIGLVAACSFILWALGSARKGSVRIVWTPLHLIGIVFLVFAATQYALRRTQDPAATWEAILKLAADFLIFFLAGQLWDLRAKLPKDEIRGNAGCMARDENRYHAWGAGAAGPQQQPGELTRLGLLVSVYTFSLALFAILQFFSSHGLIYWRVHPRWGGWVFGPYVNHNHFAGLMEMLIPIAAALALAPSGERAKSGRAGNAEGDLARRIWPLGAVLLGLAAVMLSGSRGGLIALLIEGLIFMIVIGAAAHLPRRHFTLAAVSVVSAVLVFLWLAPANVPLRLATIAHLPQSPEATLGQRQAVAVDTLHMFEDHWPTGTGFGSFETAFTPYLTFPSDLTWDHAHDDYLEILAETGAVGGLLTLAWLAVFLVAVFQRLRAGPGSLDLADSPDWMDHWIRLGAAVGCVGLLVHSLADFNLHIPANAAWFAMLAGLATAGIRRVSEV